MVRISDSLKKMSSYSNQVNWVQDTWFSPRHRGQGKKWEMFELIRKILNDPIEVDSNNGQGDELVS